MALFINDNGLDNVGVIESLLPGVREIRTPLTVGYAWLVVCWLAFGKELAAAEPITGFRSLKEAAEVIGPVATGVGISVGAYLIGVVTVSITLRTTSIMGQVLRRTSLGQVTPEWRRAERVRPILEQVVVERLSARANSDAAFRESVLSRSGGQAATPRRAGASWWSKLREPRTARIRDGAVARIPQDLEELWILLRRVVNLEQLVNELENELEYVALRLRGQNDAMYDEYDRLQAEADFRIAMFPPVAALFAVLAQLLNPLWIIGAVVAVTLLYVGAGVRAKAGVMIASGLAAASIKDRVLDRLDTAPIPFLHEPEAATTVGPTATG